MSAPAPSDAPPDTTADARALWRAFIPRLYAVAVGAVFFSFAVALLTAWWASPPPPPWIVRSAAQRLGAVLDDAVGRGAAVAAFADAVGHEVVVFDAAGAVVVDDADVDVDVARAALALDALHPAAGDPFFDEQGRRKQRRVPFLPRSDSAFATRVTTGAGHAFDVVFVRGGEGVTFVALVVGVLAVLALLVVAVARFFAGPLGELDRAVAAFGGGHVDVHVDEEKAGPYAPLAHTWNAMTARVQAARLRERELLVNVSHELRTPLARVRVAVELADEGVDDAAAVRAALADVDVDLAELEIMIDDVLTAARLESHALPPLKRASVDVDDVVAAAAERFALRHPRHTLVVQRAHGVVVGDALLLRRALLNVLDNAAKYSEARSRVTVHVDVDDAADGEVAIAVADEGVGIAAADQVRVFEPFFRVDKSRSRGAGGVGLGLAIVQGIVRAHGGTVWLTSAPGQGSTVTLRLPRAPLPSPR